MKYLRLCILTAFSFYLLGCPSQGGDGGMLNGIVASITGPTTTDESTAATGTVETVIDYVSLYNQIIENDEKGTFTLSGSFENFDAGEATVYIDSDSSYPITLISTVDAEGLSDFDKAGVEINDTFTFDFSVFTSSPMVGFLISID